MIFLDTNVLSETFRRLPDPNVAEWLNAFDQELAISTVVFAEILSGIEKIRDRERSQRLQENFDDLLRRYRRRGRIFGFDLESALIYGRISGTAARLGKTLAVSDTMIAAIAIRHDAQVATAI